MTAKVRERDRYDDDVDFLTAHPEEIPSAWGDPNIHSHGSLFCFVTPDRRSHGNCGCLTSVKYGTWPACNDLLTEAIRSDPALPNSHLDITVADLPRFAEWNRTIDLELGRKPLPRNLQPA